MRLEIRGKRCAELMRGHSSCLSKEAPQFFGTGVNGAHSDTFQLLALTVLPQFAETLRLAHKTPIQQADAVALRWQSEALQQILKAGV